MKKTKYVQTARVLILLSAILFLSAVITQYLYVNIYVNGTLYLLAILSFSIGAILAYMAALKDKEHMKTVELNKKDEMIKNITVLSKAKAYDIFTIFFSFITLFASLNRLVNVNSCVILGCSCLFLVISQIYYFFKFFKKM